MVAEELGSRPAARRNRHSGRELLTVVRQQGQTDAGVPAARIVGRPPNAERGALSIRARPPTVRYASRADKSALRGSSKLIRLGSPITA